MCPGQLKRLGFKFNFQAKRSPEVAIYFTEHQEALIFEMQSLNELVPNVRNRMHVVYEFVVYACVAQWPTYVHIQ